MAKEEHKKHPTKHHATKKVFDVTRPGKSPATPTSRPVITNPKEPVADDQFVPGAPPLRASDPNAQHDLLSGKNRKGLEPISAPELVTADDTPISPTAVGPLSSSPDTADPLLKESQPAASSMPTAPVVGIDGPVDQAETVIEEPASSVTATDTEQVTQPEETPAHLALEQTVETKTDNLPIWEHPDTSEQVEEPQRTASSPKAGASSKTIEDLLAETGAPVLENEPAPSVIISHHNHRHHHGSVWTAVLIFLLIILVAAVALNFLLDADVIKTTLNIPHTDLIK